MLNGLKSNKDEHVWCGSHLSYKNYPIKSAIIGKSSSLN